MPERIQLKCTKGWRLPAGAVSVARPTHWSNPFVVGDIDHKTGERIADRAHAVRLFEARWFGEDQVHRTLMEESAIAELRGLDLACWCPLDQPCHADVLLRIANAPAPTTFPPARKATP
jgi:hypothetical protein